jgi:hypothetical protein
LSGEKSILSAKVNTNKQFLDHQKQGLTFFHPLTSIRITCPDFSGSRLCFPAFILQQNRGMAEMLADVGL